MTKDYYKESNDLKSNYPYKINLKRHTYFSFIDSFANTL